MSLLTMGVEEEFLLVDRASGAPADRGSVVVSSAGEVLGDQVHSEFFNAQIEVNSQPTADCGALRAELARLRRTVAEAAADADCRIIASGTPVRPPDEPLAVSGYDERYARMARRYPTLVDAQDGLACGCHVHIGTLDRAQAVGLTGHIRPWLPALQALSGNSPFSSGHDTGLASWRSVRFGRWPTAGPAPLLALEAEYEAYAQALVDREVLLDRKMIYWYARPSEHVPTLEVRVADVNADLDTVVLLAALVRGLAAALLPSVAEGAPPPPVPHRQLVDAHALAAANGLRGTGLHPATGEEISTERLVMLLLAQAAPGLEATGDLPLAEQQLRRLCAEGDGASRQRAVHERHGRLRGVVDALASATCGDDG
ncbi:glutamate--cysteine ligase [Streptomyces sp. NPDC089799]|uniref:carboxylate-amine ligase n=1 Tax=Streptomyces sp. NPDC089799 TaxID=3155066 RepID=UPI003442B24D